MSRRIVVAPATPMVARLPQDDGQLLLLASVCAGRGAMIVPTTVGIQTGRVAELWLIPPGDTPHSLGIRDPAQANSVLVPKALIAALDPHAIVAVTLEPPAGGLGGKPSEPGEILLL